MANQGHIFISDGRTTTQKAVDEAARLYLQSLEDINPLPEFDRESGLYNTGAEYKPPVRLNIEETFQVIRSFELCGMRTRIKYCEKTGNIDVEFRNSINRRVGVSQFSKSALLFEGALREMLRTAASDLKAGK